MTLESALFQATTPSYPPTGLKVAGDVLTSGEIAQYLKILDGLADSESPVRALGSVPSSGDIGLVVRQVGLAAAAALADGVSNPTLTQIAAYMQMFNGSTWDRLRGTTSGLYAQGPVAHDGVMAGNPVILGGYAATAFPSAVSAADVARLYVDEFGLTHVIAGGVGGLVTVNFTREANNTAYTAGDAVNNSASAPTVLTFAGMARRNGGSGTILGALLIDEENPVTAGLFRLHLADTTFTPNNDNADAALSTTIARTFLPRIPFASYDSLSTTAKVYWTPGPFPYKCAAGTTSIFGTLVADNSYQAVAGGANRMDIILICQLD